MSDDLTALRSLAEAATPGPWHFHQDDGTALDISEVCIPRPEEDVDLSIASLLEDRDGAFIAAANPATVLALLDRVERAERELEVAMAPHSDCVESGERAGAQIDDLKSRAERAEAAIERCRGVLASWKSVQASNREQFESGNPGMIVPIDFVGGLSAALDGAPEPEWEYVGVAFEHGGFMRVRNDQLTPEKFDSWRKLVAQYPRVEILKRIKSVPAGPWVPVESEGNND